MYVLNGQEREVWYVLNGLHSEKHDAGGVSQHIITWGLRKMTCRPSVLRCTSIVRTFATAYGSAPR